ncbi:MAG TPA: nucleoside kinase [Firmicutes bacterium]|jgi:uridine kinase|nr:nucleoside kinase [Bacillota bacterium]
MEMIRIQLAGETKVVTKGVTVQEVLEAWPGQSHPQIVAAIVGKDLRELSFCLTEDTTIMPVDLTHVDGVRIYSRSLMMVFIRAAKEIFPHCQVRIMYSLSKGLYGELYIGRSLLEKDLRQIEQRMRTIIAADEKIEKLRMPVEEAIKIFEEEGLTDKVKLMGYKQTKEISVYRCGDYYDYYFGYMLPSTGFLKEFELLFHLPGFILRFPSQASPEKVPPYVEQRKLSQVFYEYEKWGEVLGVSDLASLNRLIEAKKGEELIRLAEALQEKKIAQIADEITRDRERVRLVMIAGPSSSGKTTFTQRLAIQLRVNGVRPVSLSLDDYFVSREFTPRNEKGEPDFEALEAIDLDLFNEQLADLIMGEKVEIPRFNFMKGEREYRGEVLQIKPDQPILIEGIHGLNERLTQTVPKDRKFKVYISALTQLNMDNHNRIPTTDNRLIRRIVRDSQFRSHDALTTLRLWTAVRAGEEKNIFPFQEEADLMFNSALTYELAILKKYVEPLLKAIPPDVPEYAEAKRLLKFTAYFLPLDEKEVPTNSILREFIGGSCFEC